jgi:hypothetical protein
MAAIDSEYASPAIAAPPVSDAIPARLRRVGGRPSQVLAMCVVGSLTLALFASGDLPSWADRFTDQPGAPTLQRLVRDWNDAMDRVGLTRPQNALRSFIDWLKHQGWNGPLDD